MKVSIEIECSPVEARTFFGLPDMSPLNDLMVGQVAERVKNGSVMMDPEALMKNWMNFGGSAQESFFRMMASGLPGATTK